MPVENSTEGVINHTLDRLLVSPLSICGEVEVRVHQNLMSLHTLADITEVYSHQQSLAQCVSWLDTHLPNAKRTAVNSNALAAQLAVTHPYSAAIAGHAAADIYQLPILHQHIEDETNNTTRFIVIGQQTSTSTQKDKTSLVVATDNKAGALYQMLEPFATAGVDMLSIESRPSRQGLWDYVFFIDIDGHHTDERVATALTALKPKVTLFKLLGSYPKAVF